MAFIVIYDAVSQYGAWSSHPHCPAPPPGTGQVDGPDPRWSAQRGQKELSGHFTGADQPPAEPD